MAAIGVNNNGIEELGHGAGKGNDAAKVAPSGGRGAVALSTRKKAGPAVAAGMLNGPLTFGQYRHHGRVRVAGGYARKAGLSAGRFP